MRDPVLEAVHTRLTTLGDELAAKQQWADVVLARGALQAAEIHLARGSSADDLCRDVLAIAMHVVVRTLQEQADAQAKQGKDPGDFLGRSVVALGSTFIKTLALMTGGSATIVTAQVEDVQQEPVH